MGLEPVAGGAVVLRAEEGEVGAFIGKDKAGAARHGQLPLDSREGEQREDRRGKVQAAAGPEGRTDVVDDALVACVADDLHR